jgi:rubrerythrin
MTQLRLMLLCQCFVNSGSPVLRLGPWWLEGRFIYRRGHIVQKEFGVRSVLKPIHLKIQGVFFREIVSNPKLHIFMLKHYHYLDGYAAERLKKVVKLLHDAELQAKVERHVADEAKHAAYFQQRVEELGGSIALTPDETRLGFLNRFNSHGLGIRDERLDKEKFLDVREIITFFVLLKAEEEFGLKFFLGHLQGSDQDPRTRAMLEEIVEDEKRHVSYIGEVLDKLGQSGYQADIDAEVKQYGRLFERFRFPLRDLAKALPALLTMCSFQPHGLVVRGLWILVGPIMMRLARDRA